MGQARLDSTIESLDPAVLETVLDALSHGIARSILNSAVDAFVQDPISDSVGAKPDNQANLDNAKNTDAPEDVERG